jgi:hypothetical protein
VAVLMASLLAAPTSVAVAEGAAVPDMDVHVSGSTVRWDAVRGADQYRVIDGATREPIDPTTYAIPEAQWKEICQWLIDARSLDINGANAALTWMNSGPSTDG